MGRARRARLARAVWVVCGLVVVAGSPASVQAAKGGPEQLVPDVLPIVNHRVWLSLEPCQGADPSCSTLFRPGGQLASSSP